MVGRAVGLARDLANEPPSLLNPPELARRAASSARRAGLKATVLDAKAIAKLGFGALAAVGAGSVVPARVVHLVYRPERRARRRTVLVGKGVTFDSGGLQIKPGPSMLGMKADMAGAVAVLARMGALAEVGWVTMGIVDTMMVGRVPNGTEAIGATSLGNVVFYVVGVFGSGLMLGMEFTNNEIGYQVATALFARQVLISGTYINARVLRVEPALTISYPQIDKFLNALEDSLTAVAAGRT